MGRSGTIILGAPTVDGSYATNAAKKILAEALAKLTCCYDRELLDKPNLAGALEAQFWIESKVLVTGSVATGVHLNVASCIEGVIGSLEFPLPRDGQRSRVSIWLTLK